MDRETLGWLSNAVGFAVQCHSMSFRENSKDKRPRPNHFALIANFEKNSVVLCGRSSIRTNPRDVTLVRMKKKKFDAM
jgi:hypothetical protein